MRTSSAVIAAVALAPPLTGQAIRGGKPEQFMISKADQQWDRQ